MPRILLIACLALMAATAQAAGSLKLRILDADRHTVTAARVNVIGSDSAYYEPDPSQYPLSGYSLKRKGNRGNVTPLRYFGSFFYTEGVFEIKLPPGIARIEVTKGYAYYPALAEVNIQDGQTSTYDVPLQRVIDMSAAGWHSIDTHLHFDRSKATSDAEILQMLSAEDVELGAILTVDSAKGWGMRSLDSQGRYSIVSGREATSAGLGHVNMILFNELPAAVRNSPSPPRGFPLASIYDQVVQAGGFLQHDHAGYGQEIYSDAVLGKSDAVELIQFGLYRPEIGRDGYYQLLNSGFRYPLLGGSDYPVCRTMSDSRTYVADGNSPSFPTAIGRLIRGESFATSGPMLFLSVNGKGPGSTIEYSGDAPQTMNIQVRAAAGELPFNSLEIVQDGRVVSEWHATEAVFQKELKASLKLTASSWIAARCSGPNTVHAHTNPVWIYFNGKAPFHEDAVRELRRHVDTFLNSDISEAVKSVATDAKARLDKLIQAGASPRPAPLTRFPVAPSTITLLPVVLPRPKPLAAVKVEGTVVDQAGQPVPGAQVTVRATGTAVSTDAAGHFVLNKVDDNLPLFLRLTKVGYATTNTSYLNPRATKENVRIMMLPSDMQHTQATIVISGAPSGLTFSASPAGLTKFTSKDGLTIGSTQIKFQPAYPQPSDDHEPNVIISAEGLGKDLVFPVFAGQVSYAELAH
ncbi:MAG TPA: CehA/McbA family metallohydrolase [Bryobacteraceae bacterium]|jgi:hypothetical protein